MSDKVLSLKTIDDLNRIITLSGDRAVLIYKHSTACPISSRTYRVYHQYADEVEQTSNVFFTEIFVIEDRPVSDAVENQLGVRHQSPQVLLLSNGQVVWHTSHFDISEDSIDKALQEI